MKKNKYDFSDLLQEESRNYLIEEDFYPASDYRYFESYIEDIDGGDNFADYCKDFFELLDEEEYYNWLITNKVIVQYANRNEWKKVSKCLTSKLIFIL